VEIDHRSSSLLVDAMCTRTDTEMNFNWAKQHPELFVASFIEFQKKYPTKDWKHHISFDREGYVSIIANRRTKPYNPETDYLPEIGM
jgi:hypothetical protein